MGFFFPLARWFHSTCNRSSETVGSKQTSNDQEVLNIRQFLQDYRKQKELAEGVGIEEDDTEDLGNIKSVFYSATDCTLTCWL